MKKWISLIFLFFYLVSSTELYQLLKIPIFIEHYIVHKTEDPKLSLRDFVKMHYNHPKKDADYRTDRQLPFVSHSVHFSFVCPIQPQFNFQIKKVLTKILSPKINSEGQTFYFCNSFNSIWQPPKFV